MDEFTAILNKFGWFGFVLFLIAKYGNLWWKKKTGRYVSWESLFKKLDKLEKMDNRLERVEDLVPIIQQHLKDSTERVSDLAVLKKDNSLNNEFMKERMIRMENSQEKTFQMISEIKNMMIQRSN